MELFGFEITRKRDELRATEVKNAKSFVPPVDDDGTPVIQQQSWVQLHLLKVPMVHTLTWKVVLRMRQNSFVDTVKHH